VLNAFIFFGELSVMVATAPFFSRITGFPGMLTFPD